MRKKKQKLSMVRVSTYLTMEEKADLEELHRKTGAPVAELIRRAIDAYLKENK
jgi:predicted DNA-binding protein